MAERTYANPARPSKFEDRYRVYLDESGDHVFRETEELAHRYLCLLGCWFRNPDYLKFHEAIEALKTEYLPHHPDNPVTLHREDMINARKAFKNLRDGAVRARRLRSEVFQSALTSSALKLKPKSANISGLQLADLLGHPVKQWVLNRFGHAAGAPAPFAQRLMGAIEAKFNRHLYDGRLDGYGVVLFPRAQK